MKGESIARGVSCRSVSASASMSMSTTVRGSKGSGGLQRDVDPGEGIQEEWLPVSVVSET